MPFSLRTHDRRKDRQSGRSRVVRENHYIRLASGGEPPVFIQGGRAYTAGGEPVTEIPEWVREQAKDVPHEVRKDTGMDELFPEKADGGKGKTPAAKSNHETGDMWECPVCAEQVKKKTKGLHIAQHKRAGDWVVGG